LTQQGEPDAQTYALHRGFHIVIGEFIEGFAGSAAVV